MKKQLVIIGIVTLFVGVGLSGCNEVGITTIRDIKEHSDNYINKTATVVGKYRGFTGSYYSIHDENFSVLNAVDSKNVIKPTPIDSDSEYKFTGIVRHGEIPNTDIHGIYLEVTKIEIT
jgi:hypothetical protein